MLVGTVGNDTINIGDGDDILIDAAICRTDPQNGCGNSARRARGFRARGHPAAAARSPECGQDRSASRRAKVFFAAGHAGYPDVFSPPVSREFRREPSCGFPARFRGHFVSDDPSGKFYAMITTGWRRRKSETKRNAKKQPRRSREVRRMTPTSRPRREGPVISEQPERHMAATNRPLASRFICSRRFAVFPAFCCGLFRQPVDTDTNDTVWKFRSTPRKCPGFRAPVEPSPGNPVSHLKSESGLCGCSMKPAPHRRRHPDLQRWGKVGIPAQTDSVWFCRKV